MWLKTSTSKEEWVKTECENHCEEKERQDLCITLKHLLVEDVIHSFLPPLIQAHWEPNMRHRDSYPPWAHVHQEAGWTDSGLRTRLQTFNHRSLSSISKPPLPSSARYQLSPVLTQFTSFLILFSFWNNIISESHSLWVISIMQLFFFWFLPQSSPTPLTPPQDNSLLISLQPLWECPHA